MIKRNQNSYAFYSGVLRTDVYYIIYKVYNKYNWVLLSFYCL